MKRRARCATSLERTRQRVGGQRGCGKRACCFSSKNESVARVSMPIHAFPLQSDPTAPLSVAERAGSAAKCASAFVTLDAPAACARDRRGAGECSSRRGAHGARAARPTERHARLVQCAPPRAMAPCSTALNGRPRERSTKAPWSLRPIAVGPHFPDKASSPPPPSSCPAVDKVALEIVQTDLTLLRAIPSTTIPRARPKRGCVSSPAGTNAPRAA